MYLRALEIQGFKSFPQKTRLTFEKDITAIVGPNGSGKSNISDAVRWVMGEQSTKALRGGKMEDVIFGGTEKRAPVGFAEVSLILDNSGGTFDIESSEVMITRRYYRSGDSEYYINKKSCRLKDVNELLMDTGLGREGYSIIGQGRIDEILSIKSTDRREIFEEAAGISRFRHRKEESEKKLSQAEDNLLRINDKISELEMQVEPLRKQSETAKKFLVLRDELRGLEISVWMENLEKLRETAEKLEKDHAAASLELEGAQKELDSFYAQGEVLAEKVRACDVRAEAIRDNIAKAENESGESESASAVLKATADANSENIARIWDELSGQENRRSGIEEQIKQHRDRIAEIEKEKELCAKQIEELTEKGKLLADKAEGARELLGDTIRRENELSMTLASDRSRLQALAENISEAKDALERAEAEQKSAADRHNSAKEQYNEIEKIYKDESEKLKSLENVLAGYEMRLASRKERAARNEQARVKLEMDYSALANRINLLSEMEKDYAGYSKAVKTVMQEAERGILKGVCGTVGQLIETDDDYALAIETALGAAMQNIIVDTDEIAKNAINMLKRRDGGRATFLPVSTMRGTALSDDLSRERGFEGIACELISCDEKYNGIMMYLLGRTAIVDTIDNAIAIGRKYKNRFRIVTLDGQLVNAGGSLTGGSASKSAGILSRANELSRLEKTGQRMKAELERARSAAQSSARELEASTKEMDLTLSEKRELEDGLLKTESRLSQCRIIIENCAAAEEDLSKQVESTKARLERSLSEEKSLTDDVNKTTAEIEAIRKETGEKSAGVEDMLKEADENRQKIDELLRTSATLDTEAGSAARTAESLEALSHDMAGGSARQRELIAELEKENERLASEMELLSEKAKAALERAEKYREDLRKAAQEKMDLEGERTKRDRRLQDMNTRVINLDQEVGRLAHQKLSAEMSEKQIVDKLWDTYELSRSAAKEQMMQLESIPEAQKRIGELKRDIAKLGTPNIGAIEEYERVNARYTYLTDQRADIEKSKAELDGIIGNITAEMTEIFAQKFDEIDRSFRQTFTELFGGGRASLELEDKTDILGCGIEIKVQPPGKSLKTLTLLSGGEKAFVAIALYFAILKIRPTPFVIMDEIESALDEVNNARFAEYMRRLTDNTQFLVITHRRRTMEEADVLYGVTMQEKGVSQVINIDLEEAEKTIMK